jgi:hypothetical protein
MSSFMDSASKVAALGELSAMSDDDLLVSHRVVTAHSREVDAVSGRIAAEIARRSARELGHAGLAARKGFRSTADLLQKEAGLSKAEAAKLVAAGDAPEVATAGLDAVDAVTRGLGRPDAAISAERLEQEKARLLESGDTPEQLFRNARLVRDELDADSVARREKEQGQLRYWKHYRRQDGMIAGSYLLTPDQGALLSSAHEILLSPRRGGPRFVDPDAATAARRVIDDPRTDDQYAADSLVAMVEVAVAVDAGTVFAGKKPAVKVIVRERDLAERTGFGVLEDSRDPISIAAVQRQVCESGLLGLLFDGNGQVIDVGREQRTHTARQREVIKARDGGCVIPDCPAPVSMVEVHHPNEWDRDRGDTSVENGVCLCRFDHMWLHENGYDITFAGGYYWLIPPPEIDPGQTAIRLDSKNPLLKRPLEPNPRLLGAGAVLQNA